MRVEVMAEPDGVSVGSGAAILFEGGEADPAPFAHFGRGGRNRPVVSAGESVHELVLDEAIVQDRPITRRKQRGERTIKAQLLGQPPVRRIEARLAGARM